MSALLKRWAEQTAPCPAPAPDVSAIAREAVALLEPVVRSMISEEIARLRAPAIERDGMNADEVAEFLGVERKTVYEYANRGEIPHRRLGKRLVFSRRALVAWLGSWKTASARNGER